SESCTDGCLALAKRIPGDGNSRAEQPLCIVFRECRCPNPRVRRQNTIRIGHVIGGPAKFLIPPVGEFVSKAGTECQVVPEFQRILGIPGSEPASESQLGGVRYDLKGGRGSLEKSRQAGKIRQD